LGKVTIRTNHPFSAKRNGYHISPFLQELIVYAGQLDCYAGGSKVLRKFTDIQVSDAQIFRVTNTYGDRLLQETEPQRTLPPPTQNDIVYIGVDGSMILTREKEKQENNKVDKGWKEVKLCRIFKSSDCLHPKGKQGIIKQSQYFASLGTLKEFTDPASDIIDSYGMLKNRLVFLCDGASWIRNWIADNYPEAISILDYFHACEYLYKFAEIFFTDKMEKEIWCKQQEQLLKQSKVSDVIAEIEKIGGTKIEEGLKVINYYKNNADRMDYKRYRQIGCGIIGSGSVESAHRTVIQKRMKLSGQRWSKKGAKAIITLRTTDQNLQWNNVIGLVRKEFVAAA